MLFLAGHKPKPAPPLRIGSSTPAQDHARALAEGLEGAACELSAI